MIAIHYVLILYERPSASYIGSDTRSGIGTDFEEQELE